MPGIQRCGTASATFSDGLLFALGAVSPSERRVCPEQSRRVEGLAGPSIAVWFAVWYNIVKVHLNESFRRWYAGM
jgi:hypothetical protein